MSAETAKVIPFREAEESGKEQPKARKKADHNLFLRGEVWWTDIAVGGVREKKSTGCRSLTAARYIRDQRATELGLKAERRRLNLPEPETLPVLSLEKVFALYLAAESNPYDREKGGIQEGTKRSWSSDRNCEKRIRRACEKALKIEAGRVDQEFLSDLALALAQSGYSANTRRNTMGFLRSVLGWAKANKKKTGVTVNLFREIDDKKVRARLFPKGARREFVFEPEQLRALYAELKPRTARFIRFLVHTGLRLREATTLVWGNVDMKRGAAIIEERFAKTGEAREAVLGAVALGILEQLAPGSPSGPVFTGRTGHALDGRSVEESFDRALVRAGIWSLDSGKRKPVVHDLRATAGTRVEAVSSYAATQKFLGHAASDVTARYVRPSLDMVRDAVTRAGRSIDGELPPGTIPFPTPRAEGTPEGTGDCSATEKASTRRG